MPSSPWAAWPAGADPAALVRTLCRAHDAFLAGDHPGAGVRPVVLESWGRSRRSGVDPLGPAIPVLGAAEVRARREENPLAALLPVVRRLLLDGEGDGLVVALADDAGRLLWVDGDRGVRRAVGSAGFVEGAVWTEAAAGTSAPGIALATDHEVQVFAAEHFTRAVQPWSCSAAPVHGPDGRIVGVLDVTGGDAAASPPMLSLVRATVAALEAELALRHLRERARRAQVAPAGRPSRPAVTLHVLGRGTGVLAAATSDAPVPADAGASDVVRPAVEGTRDLTLRHAEILLLLAAHPEGLTADGLAVRLHDAELSDVTVRAEVSRLRRAVPGVVGPSRPYRLDVTVRTDADDVRDLLAAGDVAGAVHRYGGPVLPRSQAPGVVTLRERLDAEVRAAVAATDDVEAVLAWALGPCGQDDWSAWRRLAALAPPGSSTGVRARARLALLDRDLGVG